MRSTFGKYLAPYLIGVIVLVIVAITVLIQTFRFTNGLAQWLFNIISGYKVALNAFTVITDWAQALSAFAGCLILVVLFANFREHRRNRSLNRLHDWARNAVVTLADYRKRDLSLQDSPLERYKEMRALIDKLKADCHNALGDARVLGGELNATTKRAVNRLVTVDEKVEKQDESAFEDLRTLQHNLADVMISAFEVLQR